MTSISLTTGFFLINNLSENKNLPQVVEVVSLHLIVQSKKLSINH